MALAARQSAVSLVMRRDFAQPRETVFAAWIDPAMVARWWPGRYTMLSSEMDVRPGGAWRLTMAAGDQHPEIRWAGEYREVVAPERLVFTVTDRPEGDEYELVTVEFTDLGDGRTRVDLAQTGGHLTPEEYEAAGQGWGSFLDDLAARLAEA